MINLKKNDTINLSKESKTGLSSLCFGLDWGAIQEKSGGFFGFGGGTVAKSVDLDATAFLYDVNKKLIDTIFFNNRDSKDRNVHLSEDDRGGDAVDDNADNEVITCALDRMKTSNVKYIAFVLNSFTGQTFDQIPYVRLRVYTGTKNKPIDILGKLELSNDSEFKGARGMVMGIAENINGEWNFKVIAKRTEDRTIDQLKSSTIKFL